MVGTGKRTVATRCADRSRAGWRWSAGAVALARCVAALGVVACTEPAERAQTRVRIEAEAPVKALVDEVEVVVEAQIPGSGGWQVRTTQRFEPKATHPWPLTLNVEGAAARLSYQVTATARDARKSVVSQARAIRDADATSARTILLVFEAKCVRLDLCPNGETCHDGDCIDAHYEASFDPKAQPDAGPMPAEDAGPDPGGPTVAAEGEACSAEGARACASELSRAPLSCESGMWRSAPVCAEDQLCDTTLGALRGSCRSVAPECMGHAVDVPFCDRDIMRVCTSMFASDVRHCNVNEHCVAKQDALCECTTGFVKGAAGCERPRDCMTANGGCDPLTKCAMSGTGRTCSACPAGYVGSGETGCEPLLASLVASEGALVPAFDPAVHSYQLKLQLLAQRATLTPTAASAMRIELNGNTVASGQPWTTPTLPLGRFPVKLTLTSSSGATSDYEISIERAGAQTGYLKASNVGEGDLFGAGVAVSGDTLVVGACFEDSAATAVDGDQTNNGASEAGAAYVFVKRGSSWEQQAYLKPDDGAAQDFFGTTVAIDGDTIVVGAIRNNVFGLDTQGVRPGAAYVFTRNQGKWSQAAKLAPATGAPGDLFGYGVTIQGGTIAIGAPRDAGEGAAYVYAGGGNDWREQAKLRGNPRVANAAFGSAVAISKDTLLVGSTDDGTEASSAGSAHVFVRSGATWSFEQRLVPDVPASDADFGYAVALAGDDALIGAPRMASIFSLARTSPGEVFGFHRSGSTWKQTHRLQAMLPRASDSFGSSLAMNEAGALIGACGDTSGATGIGGDASRRDGVYSGAGYLYAREGSDWKLSAYLKAGNADANDMFGFSAALSGTTAVFGSIWEQGNASGVNGADNDSLSQPGAVYVFQ